MKKCESITRAVGDDTGRNVMQGDSVKNSKPCCLSAITAEFQPLTDSSDIARAFLYKLEFGEIDKKTCPKFETKTLPARFVTDYLGGYVLKMAPYEITRMEICTPENKILNPCRDYYRMIAWMAGGV